MIVTRAGACRDFCDETIAWLVPAQPVRLSDQRVGELETVDYPWLLEPDPEAVVGFLRRTFAQLEEGRAMGAAGRQRILAQFTWEQSVGITVSMNRTCPLSARSAGKCVGWMSPFSTRATRIRPSGAASSSVTSGCWSWTGPSVRRTPLRCSTWARSIKNWVGTPKPYPCCGAAWSCRTPRTPSSASCSP